MAIKKTGLDKYGPLTNDVVSCVQGQLPSGKPTHNLYVAEEGDGFTVWTVAFSVTDMSRATPKNTICYGYADTEWEALKLAAEVAKQIVEDAPEANRRRPVDDPDESETAGAASKAVNALKERNIARKAKATASGKAPVVKRRKRVKV